MVEEKKLSIIVPHYNSPDLLDNLIRSIPEKNEIQIIVVDDNSNQKQEEFIRVKNKYTGRAEFPSPPKASTE